LPGGEADPGRSDDEDGWEKRVDPPENLKTNTQDEHQRSSMIDGREQPLLDR